MLFQAMDPGRFWLCTWCVEREIFQVVYLFLYTCILKWRIEKRLRKLLVFQSFFVKSETSNGRISYMYKNKEAFKCWIKFFVLWWIISRAIMVLVVVVIPIVINIMVTIITKGTATRKVPVVSLVPVVFLANGYSKKLEPISWEALWNCIYALYCGADTI